MSAARAKLQPAVSGHAAKALDAALLTMADRDERTPCQGRYAWQWTSEYRSWRAEAIPLCAGCGLLDLCAQYGDEIKASFGVWAGIDRTPATRKGKAA